jgi:hypothetical protein
MTTEQFGTYLYEQWLKENECKIVERVEGEKVFVFKGETHLITAEQWAELEAKLRAVFSNQAQIIAGAALIIEAEHSEMEEAVFMGRWAEIRSGKVLMGISKYKCWLDEVLRDCVRKGWMVEISPGRFVRT